MTVVLSMLPKRTRGGVYVQPTSVDPDDTPFPTYKLRTETRWDDTAFLVKSPELAILSKFAIKYVLMRRRGEP
jgi:hypothetical protein